MLRRRLHARRARATRRRRRPSLRPGRRAPPRTDARGAAPSGWSGAQKDVHATNNASPPPPADCLLQEAVERQVHVLQRGDAARRWVGSAECVLPRTNQATEACVALPSISADAR